MIEKVAGAAGESTEIDTRELIKQADENEEVLVVNMTKYLRKEAVAIFATGRRAKVLMKILDEISD